MKAEWQDQSTRLVELLGLSNKPVAVTFTNDEVEGLNPRKTWLCRAIKLAAEGQSFMIDRETSACPGGSWHCGFLPPPSGDTRRGLQWFLTRGEKLTHSLVSLERMFQLSSPPPTGISERLVIWPAETASLRPDLMLFICDAGQACRLIWLDHYWDGIPPKIELTGSLCHSAIAYPAVTGNTNLTLGDWTARREQKFASDAIFVTIPFERMDKLVQAIPLCSAGTAELEFPENIRRMMEGEEE